MVSATGRIAHRYTQADLHDVRRAVDRMLRLLKANQVIGLSEPERAVLGGCVILLSHIREDALGEYRIRELQMALDEESDAGI